MKGQCENVRNYLAKGPKLQESIFFMDEAESSFWGLGEARDRGQAEISAFAMLHI